MARELVINEYCDECLGTTGERTPATRTETITLARGLTRELATCDAHAGPYDALVIQLQSYGQAPTAAPNVPTAGRASSNGSGPDYRCVICQGKYASRGSLQAHVRKFHDTTLSVLEGKATGRAFTCPECDYTAANPQGLGAHRRHKHGVTGKATVS